MFFLLSSCGVNKNFESFSVSPERLFSSEGGAVFVVDYSDEKVRGDVAEYFNYLKDLKIWHETGIDLKYANFVDDLNSIAGKASFENLFLPVFKSGFKVAIYKDNPSLDLLKGSFVISANIREKDSAKILLDAYLGNKFGEKLEKMTVSGVEVWLLEEDSLFLAKKGANFIFSNDFVKFQEVLKNMKEENFSKFVLNVGKEYSFSPFIQVFLADGVKFSVFLEEKGIRVHGFFPKAEKNFSEKSLLKYLPGDGAVLLLQDMSFLSFVSLFSDFDTEKFLGLKKDEFYDLIDTRFAFLMSFTESFPNVSLLLETKEVDFLAMQKFLKFANRFFEDLSKSLDSQLISSGVISKEGLLKIETVNDGLKKAYLDLSLLSSEKLSEMEVLFPGISRDLKVEFYFGLLEDNILVLSFGQNFMDYAARQNITDSSEFISASGNLSLQGDEKIYYVNFLSAWSFYENFSKVLYSWGFLSEDQVVRGEIFRELFLDKLSTFILLGEKGKKENFFEGFLSTWK